MRFVGLIPVSFAVPVVLGAWGATAALAATTTVDVALRWLTRSGFVVWSCSLAVANVLPFVVEGDGSAWWAGRRFAAA